MDIKGGEIGLKAKAESIQGKVEGLKGKAEGLKGKAITLKGEAGNLTGEAVGLEGGVRGIRKSSRPQMAALLDAKINKIVRVWNGKKYSFTRN